MSSDAVRLVGQEIAKRRERNRWTGSELARRAGLNQSQVSQYERGAHNPSFDAVLRLAVALEVRPTLLLKCLDHEFKRRMEGGK